MSKQRGLELSEKSVFDHMFSLIERHRLSMENFSLGNFYDLLSEFDEKFSRFNTKKGDTNKSLYNQILIDTFLKFIVIFDSRGFQDQPIFYAFKKYLAYFSTVLDLAGEIRLKSDVQANFYEQFPSLTKRFSPQLIEGLYMHDQDPFRYAEVNEFEKEFCSEIGLPRSIFNNRNTNLRYEEIPNDINSFTVFANNFTAKEIVWHEEKCQFTISAPTLYYALLSLDIDANGKISEELQALSLITSAIDRIPNTTLEVQKLEKGSIRLFTRAWFKDLVAREEFKSVMSTAAETAVKKMTGESHTKIQHRRLENKKLLQELQELDDTRESNDYKRELEIEKMELQNRMLETQVTQLEFENQVKRIKLLSELLAIGLLEPDFVKVSINEILYLLKSPETSETEPGKINKGPDINQIMGE